MWRRAPRPSRSERSSTGIFPNADAKTPAPRTPPSPCHPERPRFSSRRRDLSLHGCGAGGPKAVSLHRDEARMGGGCKIDEVFLQEHFVRAELYVQFYTYMQVKRRTRVPGPGRRGAGERPGRTKIKPKIKGNGLCSRNPRPPKSAESGAASVRMVPAGKAGETAGP